MATSRRPAVLATSQVKRRPAGKLTIGTQHSAYRQVYSGTVDFEGVDLGLHSDSWTWRMLEDLAAFHSLDQAASEVKIKQLNAALRCLSQDEKTRAILDLLPSEVSISSVKDLFRNGDKFVLDGRFSGLGGARAMASFRTFVYEHVDCVEIPEDIDEQTIRFKPKAKVESDPRALISDLSSFAIDDSGLPIGALPVKSAVDLRDAIRLKAESDLLMVRTACIREMEIAATVRGRIDRWNQERLSPRYLLATSRSLQDSKHPERALNVAKVPIDARLPAILQCIDKFGLAYRNAPHKYYVSGADAMRAQLFDGLPIFSSNGIFELAQHACAEEIFAAFHLLQTYTGWNFSSVMSLTDDRIQINNKSVIVQGAKEKTDDDTPEVEIDLAEPGVLMAVQLLRWNRLQMIRLGHLDQSIQDLWAAVRKMSSMQASHTFHPLMRHKEFKRRHALPDYSLDQTRTQFLFIRSLSKGGIRAAQAFAGHKFLSTTGDYIENIIQDRISSAMNLAFSKQLESELIYIHESKTKDLHSLNLSLLEPIGDGASCIDPSKPPPGRSRNHETCDGERCHSSGGCPNRKIRIDTARIEEIVRTRFHYQLTWQQAWQCNPDRFAKEQLPAIVFNEALYQIVSAGPFAAKVYRASQQMQREVCGDESP